MLGDESTLDEHAKKWLVDTKKEINDRRSLEVAKAATAAAAEQAAMMQAEEVAQM